LLLTVSALAPGSARANPPSVAVDPPEVRQRSALDCGPAALQSVLEGFGIRIAYDRLVAECEVDPREGASIDRVEEVANRLGLKAEQIMLPADHVFLPGGHRGPALVILRAPEKLSHFLVLWRASGERVLSMDPATGRRAWLERDDLLKRLYIHEMAVPATAWNSWSHSEGFRAGVVERMRRLGLPPAASERLWSEAARDPSTRSVAALDASVRFQASRPGQENAAREIERLFQCSRNPRCAGENRAPEAFWSARDGDSRKNGDAQVTIRGAVMLLFYGRAH
jgi:ATP-binding cassette subfamily B protein